MSKVQVGKVEKQRAVPSLARSGTTTAVPHPIGGIKDVINRAMDLGNGFYLIEFKSSSSQRAGFKRQLVPQRPKKLPGIAPLPKDAMALAMRGVNIVEQPMKKPVVIKGATGVTMPDANKVFMANFAVKERRAITRLEQAGSLIDSQALAERLQMTRNGVNKAAQERRMFSLTGAGGKKLFPAFFADPGLERKQLESVCKELGDLPATSKWQFFTNSRLSLAKKNPIDALRKGKYAEVLAAANAFKES